MLEESRRDTAECAALAHDQAYREQFFYGHGPLFRPAGLYRHNWGPSPFGYHDDFLTQARRERDLQDFCLRSRGYRLTVVQP